MLRSRVGCLTARCFRTCLLCRRRYTALLYKIWHLWNTALKAETSAQKSAIVRIADNCPLRRQWTLSKRQSRWLALSGRQVTPLAAPSLLVVVSLPLKFPALETNDTNDNCRRLQPQNKSMP